MLITLPQQPPQQIFILPWHSSSHPHYLRSTLILSCHLRQNLLGISCPLSVCIKNIWHFYSFLCVTLNNTGLPISPYPDQEGNKLQRQKILSFIYPIYNHKWRNISTIYIYNKTSIKRNTGVLISPYPDQEGNKLQRQKFLSFIYPIYNHNWRNISTFHIYNKTSIKRNIFTIKQNTSGSRSG